MPATPQTSAHACSNPLLRAPERTSLTQHALNGPIHSRTQFRRISLEIIHQNLVVILTLLCCERSIIEEVLSQMPRKTGCGETDKPSRSLHAENAVKGTGEDPLYRETHTHAGECVAVMP